ncbi:hypothetical protein TSMEX_007051 [Taenia solium]|eukprot:TsM_000114700 transcript=TsM_000114700 gene=TsM_000114700
MFALRSRASCGCHALKRFVSNVAVIGCGLMGSGIAAVCASAGYYVKVLVSNDNRVKRSEDRVLGVLRGLLKNRPGDFADLAVARIKITPDISTAVSDSEIVVEAVTENLPTKRSLFQSVERLAPSSCVFASNTSALSVNEIAEVLSRREFFGGLHFFNPVQRMKLVEITRCSYTSEDTVKVCSA